MLTQVLPSTNDEALVFTLSIKSETNLAVQDSNTEEIKRDTESGCRSTVSVLSLELQLEISDHLSLLKSALKSAVKPMQCNKGFSFSFDEYSCVPSHVRVVFEESPQETE